MRSSPSSLGSPSRSASRLRKKHKRLDAICEEEYTRNHGELNEDNNALNPDGGVRRSSRVRRAPVLLDASPPPPKKRRRVDKGGIGRGVEGVKSLEGENRGSGGAWSSRLRSRVGNVSFRVKEERELPRGKRKLFEGVVGRRDDEEVGRKEELEGLMPKVVTSKRPGRIKATKHEEGHEEDVSHGSLEESKSQEVELVLDSGEESDSAPETELSGGNRMDDSDGSDAPPVIGNEEGDRMDDLDGKVPPLVGNEERDLSNDLQTEECGGDIELLSPVERVDKVDDQLESVKESKSVGDVAEHVDNEGSVGKEVDGDETVLKDANVGKEVDDDENVLKDANVERTDELKHASKDKRGHQRIKEGRRCGLCGGGSDGKPPKRLAQDNGESENEAYSGSSSSEETNYDIWDGFDNEPGWLGRHLGPINDHYGIARIWVHLHCAVWSPEVYFADFGCLKNVRAALFRGRALKCTRCGRRGATTGCRVDRCPRTYHLPCARASGCIFDHRKFLIACTDHRHLFQPRGNKYLARIKKLKARKMMWEIRKRSNEACRKDIADEERWLENCGEDEEFLKRENKRLHRDLLRLAPVYIGGSDSASENSFQGWESVAGLKDVIRCMKEVVILPLLYPELFDNLGLTPPRGVLLHGHPGTGKTLVVRALIGACARGDKRIAYFARKGADCLGKYVGDAERQLRLLFQVAEKCQPSIIFFDEIDGLAPRRTRQQDQTHSSVVSTLLALMDGLKSRGSVVVIGATNRPEAVDPALRRPGRFDREIYFPLPSIEDRASILSLHTQKWPKPITGSLLEWIARKTPGFAGADLQALCTQAAINALKRNFPLQEVLSLAAEEKHSGCKHIPLPSFAVEERDWLEAFFSSPPPCSRRDAGNAANDVVCSPLPIQLIPCLLQPLCTLLVSLYLDERLWLPLPISKAVTVIKDVMVSALDKKQQPFDRWWLHMDDFLQETNTVYELKRKLTCSGILSADDSIAGSYDTVDDANDNNLKLESAIRNPLGMRNGLFALANKSGFRILISGNPRSGQRHLASCLLHCFIGNIEIQKIDMATILQEGHGEVVQGIAQILMKCASRQSCIVFLPRIDLWAVEKRFQIAERTDLCLTLGKSCFTPNQVIEKENEINTEKNSTEMTKGQANTKASYAWMSFIEQVESIGVSTSLMILATSEVPYTELPHKVREFFKSYQTKDSQSTPLEQTVPRFSLQIDGNFNHDLVINLSAVELLRNVVEQQVQLIHQRSHVHMCAQKAHRTYESIEVCKDKVCQSKEDGSANDKKSEIQLESFTKVPPTPNSKSLKGKSTLLLAISTLGYQILLYPHFAELCWVTSKLEEGPCADVSGPWRGWPFNSCIIRPSNSHDQGLVSCSSGGIKSREVSGLVRGLIAIGLSAYRGVYKSVREVSLDVRKVLEILIEKINTKIQAGKDRYQYFRILSQVAYLEDMVNNWAYTLLSLEQDSPEHKAKVIPASGGSLNSHLTGENHQTEGEDCHLVVPVDGRDLEILEGSHKGIPSETTGCLASNDKNDNLDILDRDDGNASPERSLQNHSFSDKHINNSAAANQPLYPSTSQENGTLLGQSESGTAGNIEVVGGELGVSKDLNKSVCTHSVVLSENGVHTACEPETQNVEIGNLRTDTDQPLSLSSVETGTKVSDAKSDTHENATDNNVSSSNGRGPVESGVICLYQCCPTCLQSLHHLTKKILVGELRLNSGQWTVEDVHDAVASLSVDLISAVRKCFMAEDFIDSSNKTSRHEKNGASLDCLNLKTCDPGNQGKDVVAAECVSHSASQHATAMEDTVLNESPKLDLKFVFRDGVLVHMDPDKDVPLHCKFENLCLCSLKRLDSNDKAPF
ncbi:Tat-binding-like 7 [Spatholobus suberectus]|nr:Tat-binding-like 7 [Spatholobus suberectus]